MRDASGQQGGSALRIRWATFLSSKGSGEGEKTAFSSILGVDVRITLLALPSYLVRVFDPNEVKLGLSWRLSNQQKGSFMCYNKLNPLRFPYHEGFLLYF